MSRLAFDDILKPNQGLGAGRLRTDSKSRFSIDAEETSSFDDTFKQAVEDLRPNERSDTDEDRDAAAQNSDSSREAREEQEAKPLRSDKDKERIEDDSRDSDKESDDQVEASSESDDSSDSDPDDVLIAMVMAAAQEQAEAAVAETEGISVEEGAVEAVTDEADPTSRLLSDEVLVIDEKLAEQIKANQQVVSPATEEALGEDADESEEPGAAGKETSSQTAEVSSIVASSEVVVPQEVAATTEAVQATVTSTSQVGAAENSAATQGQEASATMGVTQGNAEQQSGDMDQDANSEDGEPASLEMSQMAASKASSEVAEDADQVADSLKNTTDTEKTVKTETLVDRPAAATHTESRSGHQGATNATQQSTESTLDTADRVRFVERVAQAFNAQAAENRAIRMKLHPEELGEIKLEMTVRDGTMHARIETETREARNLLMDNLPALRERLATHNIKVEQFDIDYNAGGDQQGTPHSPDDWSGSDRNGSNRSTGSGANATEELAGQDETPVSRPVSRAGWGKQLDMTA